MKYSAIIAGFMLFPMSMFAATFSELHVGGAIAVSLVNNADSVGVIKYNPAHPVEVQRAADALYVTGSSMLSPTDLVPVTVYSDGSLKVIDVTGRAKLDAQRLFSADNISIVASGAASIKVGEVEAPVVNISLSGSGTIGINGKLTASNLNFSLVGSGKIEAGSVTASRMTVNQRGSGTMTFAGSARNCYAAVNGTGKVDLRALVADVMDLKLFGDGRIFYPGGVRVSLAGKTERIIQVQPYHPL